MNKPTIGVILEHGHVKRVVTDNEALLEINIVVIENDDATKLLNPSVEHAITDYVSAARAQNLVYFFGTAAEVAGDALVELSKRDHSDPVKLLTEIEGVMGALHAAILEALHR